MAFVSNPIQVDGSTILKAADGTLSVGQIANANVAAAAAIAKSKLASLAIVNADIDNAAAIAASKLAAGVGAGTIIGCTTNAAITASSTVDFFPGGAPLTAVPIGASWVVPRDGKLRRLRVLNINATGAAETIQFVLRINGANGALTATIPQNSAASSEAADDSNEVSVSAGDNVLMRCISTDTSNNGGSWAFEYAPGA